VAPLGECDFVHDVASLFPVSIFMELMGMPAERLREFRALADGLFNAHTPEEFAVAYPAILKELNELIEARQRKPGDDMISTILAADLPGLGRKMTLDEVQRMTYLLYLGGMDTVTNVTGFTYQHLSQDPALQARLAREPEVIPQFVEEGLRMYGVASGPRMVVQDCERFGVRFRVNDMVLNALCLGGRDDRVNPNPNVFDIDRPNRQNLAFSTGPHLCVGHILARAEMRILTEAWFKRVPSFSAKPGIGHRFRLGTVNALESLPIQWAKAA
jgi:cytochrome P450